MAYLSEELMSLAAEFWRALNASEVNVARDATQRISPPDVGAFSFDAIGGEGGEQGTLGKAGKLSTATPVLVAYS